MNLDILNIICFIIMSLFPVLYLSQNIFAIFGLFFKARKYKKATTLHNYGYLICAHDEEDVIANLIHSIKAQDYPKELMHIFVVCDNCKDHTKEIAMELGCYIIERNDLSKIGKCYALDYAIKEILAKYNHLNLEAFFVFDADNLVGKEYTMRMNDVFDAGYEVASSFRNSKNFKKNILTSGAGFTFLRECEIIHKGRNLCNVGTYISGTGFYVSMNILEQINGWPFETLIEDIEFSIYCANNNIKIGYHKDAIFYDEQPENFKDSYFQRLRWCRGTHQCFIRHCWSLIKGIFKNKSFACYEMLMHVAPIPAITLIWSIIYISVLGINAMVNNYGFMDSMHSGVLTIVWYFIGVYLMGIFHAFVVIIHDHKRIDCNKFLLVLYGLLFPLFMFMLLIISVISMFVKVEWKKIKHSDNKSIEEIEGEVSE